MKKKKNKKTNKQTFLIFENKLKAFYLHNHLKL